MTRVVTATIEMRTRNSPDLFSKAGDEQIREVIVGEIDAHATRPDEVGQRLDDTFENLIDVPVRRQNRGVDMLQERKFALAEVEVIPKLACQRLPS